MALFRQRIVEVPPALEGKILNLTKVTPKYILQHTEPAKYDLKVFEIFEK